MSEPPLPDEAGAPDPDAERVARQARGLRELAEIGLSMARMLHERMAASERADESSEMMLAFTQGARTVRLTFALETRLAIEHQARIDARLATATEARAAAVAKREARGDRNTIRVSDAVEVAIVAHTADFDDGGYESERLSEALSEHLEDPRETEAFADIPVSVAVAQVCKALGVRVDWSLWRNEDWAVDEWRAGTPGSPYAETPPADDARASIDEPAARGPPMRRLS